VAAEVIVSYVPSATWPILEVISKPGKIEDSCGQIEVAAPPLPVAPRGWSKY